MARDIAGVDHPIVGVRDLEQGRSRFARLGFVATPRGGHREWGTANHCLMFSEDYIELLAAGGEGPGAARVRAFLERRGEGLMGYALKALDTVGAVKRLSAGGLAVGEPRPLSRAIETPEGPAVLSFVLADLPETVPGIYHFLCQHRTPALMRRPEWLAHPNGALGLAALTLWVEEPERVGQGYERVLGPGAATPTGAGVEVRTGGAVLVLSRPDEPSPPVPALVGLSVWVEDTERTAEVLRRNGVAFSRAHGSSIRVPREEACGLHLEFMQRQTGGLGS
jgi:hypothetical protein